MSGCGPRTWSRQSPYSRGVRIATCVLTAPLLLVAACKGEKQADPKAGDDSRAGTAASAASSQTFPKLTVTSDGKPVAMARAFIKRVSPDQWRILVGDTEGSCEELLSGVTNRAPGGTSFVASIGKRLKPDGSETMVVTDFWSAGHPTESVTGLASIAGTPDAGAKVEVKLGKIVDVDKARKLEISGAFTALGCGDQPPPAAGLPKAKHPSTAAVTIAGKRIAVASAIRSGDAITLTTGPRDCTPATVPAQATIEHRAGRWELTGTWFAQPSTSTDNALGDEARTKDLKITPGDPGDSTDGKTIALALAGSGKLGDYPVALEGTIEAIDCPK
jgi:hypothetical protein